MARGIHRLDPDVIRKETRHGHYSDGGGLYLQVSKWGTRSWVFKYTLGKKATKDGKLVPNTRGMGLGPFVEVESLAKARKALAAVRDEAADLRNMVKACRDPIEERKAAKQKAVPEVVSVLSFKEAVDRCLARKEGEFRSDRHGNSWRRSMEMYAFPVIGDMNVAHITTQDVLRVFSQQLEDEPGASLWEGRTETASRLRGRIEAVLSWATVAGFRSGDNPARWAGNLKELLPKPSKVTKVTKRPALSQGDLPAWFADLRKRGGMSARALEFVALCACRSAEARGATWAEIDLEARMWRIPAARMKSDRDHRVPLPDAAIALLKALPRMAGSPYLFPAPRGGALSDAILSQLMAKMHEAAAKDGGKGYLDAESGLPAVPHGLRSSFRVWAAERGYDRDMAELALAHAVGSAVERAYMRSDMIDRRRAMMADWAGFLAGLPAEGNVVQLRGGVA